MSELKYWLWLSSETGVSPGAKAALIERYGGAEQAFHAPKGEFARIDGVTAREASMLERRDLSATDRIQRACRARDIAIVTMDDESYPVRLKNIYAPPVVIYVTGKLPDIDRNAVISVIGTRKASPYGLKMSRNLSYEVCSGGAMVVSLMMSGVDEAVARGALEAGGICIGVLGTSHDHERRELLRAVARSGAVVSEYPPATETVKSFFRDRNRIAAGLSVGVLVVEAPAYSGTGLFVQEAAEQGKELFAVPGNADSPNSVGTNAMIKDGAKLVTEGRDVLEEFELLFPEKIGESAERDSDVSEKNADPAPETDKKEIDNKNTAIYSDQRDRFDRLSDEQRSILSAIEKTGGGIDDVIAATGLRSGKVLSHITMLEMKGFIRREAGVRIVLNSKAKK